MHASVSVWKIAIKLNEVQWASLKALSISHQLRNVIEDSTLLQSAQKLILSQNRVALDSIILLFSMLLSCRLTKKKTRK